MIAKRKKTEESETTEEVVVAAKIEKDEGKVDGAREQTVLTDIEDYIKTSSYLGTKVITPTMRKYVYRRRMDGLAILNTLLVDAKLKEAIEFIVQFKPADWTLVCKREAGWRGAKMFAELTGVRTFTKKYPSGVLTNLVLPTFFETKMIMVCDPWLDKNALADAKRVKVPVVGICNTNNNTNDIYKVIIGNNHSNKSLGLFFWLLAREYMKAHGIKKPVPSLEDFVGEKLILEEPKKKKGKSKEEKLKSEEEKIEEKMKQLSEKAEAGAEEGV
jgi:ribosomal protein uS2